MIKIETNEKMANAITHTGKFHADEVFCTVIIEKLLGDVQVFRTFKVPENLKSNIIIYDVGGGELDHHQKGGNGCRKNGVPYAAAGLVWLKYGHTVLQTMGCPNEQQDAVLNWVDRDLIQGIDAVDNGKMPQAEYPCQPMTISKVIGDLNPTWDSETSTDAGFLKACDIARIALDNAIKQAISKARAQEIVESAIERSQDHIMVLEKFAPWQEYIFASESGKAKEIWIVVFPSNRGGYNFQVVPDSLGSFGQRKAVPNSWKGLSGEALQKETGVTDATFCHPAGFIGGAQTLDGALDLARKAVNS